MPLRSSILLVFSVVIIFLSYALPDDGVNQKVKRQHKYAQNGFLEGEHGRNRINNKKEDRIHKNKKLNENRLLNQRHYRKEKIKYEKDKKIVKGGKSKHTEKKTKKITSKIKLKGNSNRTSQVKNMKTTRVKIDYRSRRKPTKNKCKCGLSNTQRIIGGDKINPPRKYPWLVFINGHSRICSGSLISSGHVLTAAHCVHNGKKWVASKGWKVYIGDHNLKKTSDNLSEETFIMKAKIIKQKKFNSELLDYDIVLMKFEKQIDLDHFHNIHPICLPENAKSTYKNKRAIGAGWGLTSADNKKIPYSPYEITLKTTKKKCSGYLITKNMICTDVLWAKKSPYTGDSGGPLMVEENGRFVQIGILSHGLTMSEKKGSKAVVVYTSVTKLLKWILNNIRGDNTCT